MKKFPKLIVGILIGILQFTAFGQSAAIAQSSTGIFTVNVNTPGTFGQIMLQTVENWSDVVELTITGHLNSADMAYFSRMQNMTKLDVSQTDITSIMGCNGLVSLQNIVLSESVVRIEDDAFNGCIALSTITLNSVKEIGNNAFSNCNGLTGAINGPKVISIGSSAFYHCNNIESVSFPVIETIGDNAFEAPRYENNKLTSVEISNVKHLGSGAFQYCSSLKSIDISNCEEIGSYGGWTDGCFSSCHNLTTIKLSNKIQTIPHSCFYDTGIQSIEMPSSLKIIEDYAFQKTKISELNLPEGLEIIQYNAFKDCPLTSISLPSTIQSISDDAFNSPSLTNVYCYAVVPINTSVFNNERVKAATLHVPTFSVSAYKLDDNWYMFNKIEALDGNLTDITINNDFTIVDYTGLANNVNVNLISSETQNTSGHLTISANSTLSLGNFIQSQNFKYERNSYEDENGNYTDYYSYPYCTTMIPNNEVRANSVTTKILLPTNKWSFISMPYDVNVSDIKVPKETMWVVRKYNGSNRAAMSGDTWENVTSGQILNAGEGYIFHCINENSDSWSTDYIEFEFPAINNANKNNLFDYNDIVKTINEYPAEFSHNRGWNLIGNPYPSYFSSQYLDFPAPITVWNGEGYTAYSLADDEYVLRPNEAFFIQCPVNTNQIKFSKDGRTHNYISSSNPYYPHTRTQSSSNRAILNFVLSDENYSDRTRLVINETAASDYEIEKDASKFMSNNADVPQIYIIDNGINFAIDERPIGTGEYALGVRIGKDGNYKISLNTINSDYDVLLIDKDANETVNLSEREYIFTASSQTSNKRFFAKITPKGGALSINEEETKMPKYSINGNQLVVDGNVSISVISIDGKVIYNGIVDGPIELPSGIYILSINNITYKIAIK